MKQRILGSFDQKKMAPCEIVEVHHVVDRPMRLDHLVFHDDCIGALQVEALEVAGELVLVSSVPARIFAGETTEERKARERLAFNLRPVGLDDQDGTIRWMCELCQREAMILPANVDHVSDCPLRPRAAWRLEGVRSMKAGERVTLRVVNESDADVTVMVSAWFDEEPDADPAAVVSEGSSLL